jgi:hypothetical protein
MENIVGFMSFLKPDSKLKHSFQSKVYQQSLPCTYWVIVFQKPKEKGEKVKGKFARDISII